VSDETNFSTFTTLRFLGSPHNFKSRTVPTVGKIYIMDITFITLHDLSPNATILYASQSVSDVLGYEPSDVVAKSCFDFFHPEQVPLARDIHSNQIKLDKAAMLSYCKLKNKQQEWVGCECVFTVVYDVFIAATTIHTKGLKSEKRKEMAPEISAVFSPVISSTPADPRYHMIKHLSTKFVDRERSCEPRVAFIINRYSRTLPILYATHTSLSILGISAEDIRGHSFLKCISENHLEGAVDAIERAKENDSLAYLRFPWRNPFSRDSLTFSSGSQNRNLIKSGFSSSRGLLSETAIQCSTFEVEAVVTCTSDGIVVVLRRARQMVSAPPVLFASPWATNPLPPPFPRHCGEGFLQTARDMAVFVWSIRINEEVFDQYAQGRPNKYGDRSDSYVGYGMETDTSESSGESEDE
ncbi:Aryl hydrocarbon receptor nuclear translocator, partial [Neolecta irregularis DAH-3]